MGPGENVPIQPRKSSSSTWKVTKTGTSTFARWEGNSGITYLLSAASNTRKQYEQWSFVASIDCIL